MYFWCILPLRSQQVAWQHVPLPFGKLILVGGLEHVLFSHILGIIIPIDFHIFQRGSNTNQPLYTVFYCYI